MWRLSGWPIKIQAADGYPMAEVIAVARFEPQYPTFIFSVDRYFRAKRVGRLVFPMQEEMRREAVRLLVPIWRQRWRG